MRLKALIKRNFLELIRDPLTIIFAILLPVLLLFIFQQFNIPSDIYKIENFAPGILIFGFSFLTMFTATLVSKDRTTSLLARLMSSPLKAIDFILGYSLSIIPMALLQGILFFVSAIVLGLTFSVNVIITILLSLPIAFIFIFLGILIGSITNDKASPGVGSIIVQLVVFTSGMYFDISQVGKVLEVLSNLLPFSYTLNIMRGSINGTISLLSKDIIISLIYLVVLFIIAIFTFHKKMQSDN